MKRTIAVDGFSLFMNELLYLLAFLFYDEWITVSTASIFNSG